MQDFGTARPVHCSRCGHIVGNLTPNGLRPGAELWLKCRRAQCKTWSVLRGV